MELRSFHHPYSRPGGHAKIRLIPTAALRTSSDACASLPHVTMDTSRHRTLLLRAITPLHCWLAHPVVQKQRMNAGACLMAKV